MTLHEYEGAGHAFALAGGHNYDQGAADTANTRSLEFLSGHPGRGPAFCRSWVLETEARVRYRSIADHYPG
ncbi:MAG: dienelactone hydrolase family protein [Rhodospirillales bacterium]|nr:dienelactone hydrolase family protein [Rhodospirillales bacterium]